MEIYDMNEHGEVTPHEPIPALEQYPYDEGDGIDRICYYSKDGAEGKLICAENGSVYDEKVIELYPCNRHYFEYEEEEVEEVEESIDTGEEDSV